MIYIYDLVLNWTDQDRVYEFFEWELNDEIEHIKRIPLFKIEASLFDEVFHYNIMVDKEFLNKIYNLTEKYTNVGVEPIAYSCVLTDGIRVIAIEFDDEGKSIYRSRMLLDEEQDVLVLSNKLSPYKISFNKTSYRNSISFITRRESEIRKLLTLEINNSYKNGNFDKLKYLYFEFFGKENNDIDTVYKKLLQSIDKEINYNHNKLYEVIKLSYQNKS